MSEATSSVTGEKALLFDGQHAAAEAVHIEHDARAGSWRIHRSDGNFETIAAMHVSSADDSDRVQSRLALSDGRLIELAQPRSGAWRVRDPSRVGRWIRERRNAWFSAIAVLLLPVFILTVILPGAVNLVAPRIPMSFEARLGETVLTSVTRSTLRPTSLPADVQERLRQRFDALAQAAELPTARLLFYSGMANAFALPGGAVVVTDELIGLLGDDHYLVAVLAHELGHVAHRDALRGIATHLIASQLLTVAMSQDELTTKVVDLVASNVLSAQYSQSVERQADRYACELLAKTKQSPAWLGDAFAKFIDLGKRYNTDLNSGTYTSSHPPTVERIAASKACAEEHGFMR